MKVTGTQPLRGSLIKITFDSGNPVTLNRETAALAGIREGACLSEDELNKIVLRSDTDRAKSRALWYLGQGDCSQKGMLQKLKRAGFCYEACTKTVDRLTELGLLNDEAYATRLSAALSRRFYSARQIQAKLTEKGISPQKAKEAVETCAIDPRGSIRELINRKYSAKLGDKDQLRKVFAALARRGFSLDDIRAVLREYDNDNDYCEE